MGQWKTLLTGKRDVLRDYQVDFCFMLSHQETTLIMKMFYFQDFLMWPARCFISQQDFKTSWMTKNCDCLLLISHCWRGSNRFVWPETSHVKISHPYPGSSFPFSLLTLPQSLSHTCSTSRQNTLPTNSSSGWKEEISWLTFHWKKKWSGDPLTVSVRNVGLV